jgi:predicted O-methyltransferase YrrM
MAVVSRTSVLRFVAEAGQRLRVNVSPHHFYSDVPDFKELRRDKQWRHPMSMLGVGGADIVGQAEFLRSCCPGYPEQGADSKVYADAIVRNGEAGYGPIEAKFLYCFIRTRRPGRIVQVGCGVSTAIVLRAAQDAGYSPVLTCIEPYPTELLREEQSAGRIRLLPERAQRVSLDELTALGPGDLLFVDSTHTVKVGSEVVRIILEVMPRLVPGVMVHFHDIYFPYDYSPGILGPEVFLWRESTLLMAFLAMNPGYRILTSMSMLHHAQPDSIRQAFPDYTPMGTTDGLMQSPGHFPASTFLERTKGPNE